MMNALLIDHDLECMAALERLLRQDGRLETISRCVEPGLAMAQLRRDKPDVIFLDTRFRLANASPEGVSLAMRIRKLRPLVHLVFVSSDPGHAYEACQAFPLAFIKKPVLLPDLQAALERLFLHHGSPPVISHANRNTDAGIPPLRCFGEFEIMAPPGLHASARMPTGLNRALLAYLIACYDRRVDRSELLLDLLPERNDDRAVNLIHVHLYRLRRFLERNRYILRDAAIRDQYRLVMPDGVCDVVDFARYIRQPPSVTSTSISRAEAVASLYRGPCFAGEEYPWVEGLRAEMEIGYEHLLLRIAEYRLSKNEPRLGEETLRTLVRINPLSEAGRCMLMNLLLQRQERIKFITEYERYQQIMHDELNAPVDHYFQQAYRQWRRG